tara:strand:- start:41439 stop:42170 length:732 start_codon:yes stop_codon:yes gene_type:complete
MKKLESEIIPFAELEDEFMKFNNMDARNKLKCSTSLINKIRISMKNLSLDICQLEQCIHFLHLNSKYDTKNLSTKIATQCKKNILKLKGIQEPKLLMKKSKILYTPMGGYVFGDPIFWNEYSEKNKDEFLKQGKSHFFSNSEGDGQYRVTIMLVDCASPIPPQPIFDKSVDNSGEFFVEIQSGEIGVTAYQDEIKIPVEKGVYKISIYCRPNPYRYHHFYLVLSKTNEAINNEQAKIFEPLWC